VGGPLDEVDGEEGASEEDGDIEEEFDMTTILRALSN
jgi:hypothetical protein